MVKRNKIQKTLNKQWDEMIKNLLSLCKNFDQEKLHDLRLNNKKVKAIIHLLKECLPNKKKFTAKKLNELFDKAGTIRTAQLNLKTLDKHSIQNEEFKHQQNQIIKNESEELCKRKDTYSRNIKKLQKTITKNLTGINNQKIISYYHKNLKELSINFRHPINPEYLHEQRKIIKKLLYALKIIPAFLKKEININTNYLDALQDAIGNWHDDIVTLETLTHLGINEEEALSSLICQKQTDFEAVKNLSASFDIEAMYATH
ncbi:MAG: hypothetical protein JWQ09_442 [Segetibacter sp.]|nr:hypothetical protein [Segetibacter sp.]